MILNYKYRLIPNQEQEKRLEQHFFAANQIWNYALNIRMKDLKNKKGFTSTKLIEKYIKTKLKVRSTHYHSGILQQTLTKLDDKLKIFFKQKRENTPNATGFPKFKKSHKIEQSFEFKNQSIQITEKYFKIMNMKINWKYHRELPSRPLKVLIKREPDGKFYVTFSVDCEQIDVERNGISAGIDLNVKNVAVADTNGVCYLKTITKLAKYSKKYKKIEKNLSKRYENKSKTKNTKRLQKKLNGIHKKVKNVKEDFFHKLSNELVKNFDKITAEKLEIRNMNEGNIKRLRKDISEVSWGSLIEKLIYKAERHDKTFIQINPAYTSQRCNCCGFISRKNRKSQSIFKCVKCLHEDNADINAAKNIRDYDQWYLEQIARWDSRPIKSS